MMRKNLYRTRFLGNWCAKARHCSVDRSQGCAQALGNVHRVSISRDIVAFTFLVFGDQLRVNPLVGQKTGDDACQVAARAPTQGFAQCAAAGDVSQQTIGF